MRLVQRLGGGSLFAATAAITTLVVVACATGTATSVDLGEGGTAVEDASRDVNVVPLPRDSAVPDDGGTLPGDDAGAGCTQKVVINELKTDGTTANDEMVELYNPSTCAVPLGNWEIKYQSSAGSPAIGLSRHKFAVGDSIAAKGFLVLTPGGSTDLIAGMAKSDGQLGLFDDKGTQVDGVAYGAITGGSYKEGTAAASPASGGSIGRSPNGVDSNNNKSDFKAYGTPSPGIANP
jgi:hypothetical protein